MPSFEEIGMIWDTPTFIGNTQPHGALPAGEPGAQALFWYFLKAQTVLEKAGGQLVMEGDADPLWDLERLYRSACTIYQVEPGKAQNFWPAVDAEVDRMNLERGVAALRRGEVGTVALIGKLAERYRAPVRAMDREVTGDEEKGVKGL